MKESTVLTRIKYLLFRIEWFLKNYKKIAPGVKLIPNIFHGEITFQSDSVATSNNCDFVKDPKFVAAYKQALSTNPGKDYDMKWRVYIVCTLADIVKHHAGDFVECGVYTGAYSKAVIEYTNFVSLNKTFYLMDTFDGLDLSQIRKEELEAGVKQYLDQYKNVYDQVVESFSGLPVNIIKGKIPDTLPLCKTEKVCYLSIDMNVVQPEIAAANYFWDKIVSGGVIVLDDYGFPMHIEQKKAFDVFAKERGVNILSLPTGQGIIFKP